MLKTIVAATLCGIAVAVATPVLAQDQHPTAAAVGEWELTYETPRGETKVKVTISQTGEAFTGSAEMQRGTVPLSDISVEGNHLAFTMTVGRGDRNFTLQFTGTVDGDTASGTMRGPRGDRETPWTGRRIST